MAIYHSVFHQLLCISEIIIAADEIIFKILYFTKAEPMSLLKALYVSVELIKVKVVLVSQSNLNASHKNWK